MKKVVFILWGNIKYDGRVQKEIHTLQKNDYDVELIIQNFENDDLSNYDFKIHYFNFRPTSNQIKNFFLPFKFSREAEKLLKELKPDIVHCNDLNTLYTGYLYKKSGADFKLVYDSHELFPESFIDFKRRFVWGFVEKRMVLFADEIIIPEKNRSKYFAEKYELNNINVIENFPLVKKLGTVNLLEKIEPSTKGKIKLLYIGSISENRGVKEMVQSIPLLPKEYCLILIGYISNKLKDSLEKIIRENDIMDRVFILQPVENKNVLTVINSSDIGLLFYNNGNINDYYCASNKLFEFIICSKYVVTNDFPGLREVVVKNQFGQCLKNVNPAAIAEAIRRIDIDGKVFENTEQYLWSNREEDFLGIYA